MTFKQNLGPGLRLFYAAGGAALIAAPFILELTGWPKAALIVFGLVGLAEGAAGW